MLDPREGLTPDGLIATGADRSRVPAAYEAALEQAVAGAGGHVGELHLYGSVATGTARSPGSDVDLLAIDADPEEMARLAGDLGRRFEALCREVTVGVAQPDDLRGVDDAAYGSRVFLRHYCVPLLGGTPTAAPVPSPVTATPPGPPTATPRHTAGASSVRPGAPTCCGCSGGPGGRSTTRPRCAPRSGTRGWSRASRPTSPSGSGCGRTEDLMGSRVEVDDVGNHLLTCDNDPITAGNTGRTPAVLMVTPR